VNKIRLTLVLSLAFGVCATSQAQLSFGDSDQPILVEAEKATYNGNVTLLSGNVRVRQGDANIKSDEMEVYREKNASDITGNLSLGAVTRIVAIGNFSYRTPEDVVTGNVSVGKPGSSRLSGEKLVYDLKTKRARVGAGNDRVNFSINQRKE